MRVGKGICVLSPRLWEQGGQLKLSSWKEAGRACERAPSRVGKGQALGNEASGSRVGSPTSLQGLSQDSRGGLRIHGQGKES